MNEEGLSPHKRPLPGGESDINNSELMNNSRDDHDLYSSSSCGSLELGGHSLKRLRIKEDCEDNYISYFENIPCNISPPASFLNSQFLQHMQRGGGEDNETISSQCAVILPSKSGSESICSHLKECETLEIPIQPRFDSSYYPPPPISVASTTGGSSMRSLHIGLSEMNNNFTEAKDYPSKNYECDTCNHPDTMGNALHKTDDSSSVSSWSGITTLTHNENNHVFQLPLEPQQSHDGIEIQSSNNNLYQNSTYPSMRRHPGIDEVKNNNMTNKAALLHHQYKNNTNRLSSLSTLTTSEDHHHNRNDTNSTTTTATTTSANNYSGLNKLLGSLHLERRSNLLYPTSQQLSNQSRGLLREPQNHSNVLNNTIGNQNTQNIVIQSNNNTFQNSYDCHSAGDSWDDSVSINSISVKSDPISGYASMNTMRTESSSMNDVNENHHKNAKGRPASWRKKIQLKTDSQLL